MLPIPANDSLCCVKSTDGKPTTLRRICQRKSDGAGDKPWHPETNLGHELGHLVYKSRGRGNPGCNTSAKSQHSVR